MNGESDVDFVLLPRQSGVTHPGVT